MQDSTIQKNPKVSIGMPVYNGGNTIEKTIKTILSQDFNDFELIISDDCSNDATKEICQKYRNFIQSLCFSCSLDVDLGLGHDQFLEVELEHEYKDTEAVATLLLVCLCH